jgi:hypothetical protein
VLYWGTVGGSLWKWAADRTKVPKCMEVLI